MSQLTGPKQIFNIDTLTVDSSQVTELGTRAWTPDGKEFIYLQGTASVVARDWVVYDEGYTTTRLTANEVGPVAIAPTAIVTGQFGWFQVYGVAQGNCDSIDADKSLYIDGTAGRVDDLSVAGDIVLGAYSMTAAVSNVATVYITYPHVSDDVGGGAGSITGPSSSTDNAVIRWDGVLGESLQNSSVTINDTGVIFQQGASGTVQIDTNNISADRIISWPNSSGTLYISGGTDVAVADGGTGASTAADARTNLGLVIGTNVQAFDNDLSDLAALAHSASAMIVSDGTDWKARTPTETRGDLSLVIGTNVQAWDNDLDDIAALTHTASALIVSNGTDWVKRTAAETRGDLGLATTQQPTFASATLSNFTTGSIPFFGASGVMLQDNSNLFFDDGNNRLGVGTTTPDYAFHVAGTAKIESSLIIQNPTATATISSENVTAARTVRLPDLSGTAVVVTGTLGSAGQVLTSNGTGTAPSFQAAAAGGGGGTTIIRWLKAGEAALPNTAGAAINKFGTSFIMNVLDYDSSSSEAAFFYTQVPTNIVITAATASVHWFCSSGFTADSSDAVDWNLNWRSITAGEGVDATTGPAQGSATVNSDTAAQGTATVADFTITAADLAAGDLLQLALRRQPSNAGDDLAADARVIGISLQIS